jgi:hypothetical protein
VPLPQTRTEELPRNTHVAVGLEEVETEVLTYETQADSYGTFRVYRGGPPSFTPDELHTVQQVVVSVHLNRHIFSRITGFRCRDISARH